MKKIKLDIDKKTVKEPLTKGSFKTAEVITLVLITCVVSLTMGILLTKAKPNNIELASDKVQDFLKEYNYIIDNYYGKVNEQELLDAALKGVIDALGDPYSNSFDDESSDQFNAKLNGSYEGIGISVSNNKNNDIIVMTVFENSPAAKAGIKEYDIITSVNDKKINNMEIDNFTDLIKSINTSNIKLEITRDNKTMEMTVKRELVVLQSATSKTFNKNNKKIGYINVSIFANNTYEQFKTELDKLEKDKIDSLIIDLRGNTGGHLTTVENMISMFLDKNNVIYQIEDKNKKTKYYSKGKTTKEYKLVVLTDGGSASASEMMTAALKESYGATVIGTKTFGKGTVQEMQNSQNDSLQYKITTKKWLTPKGNWIDGVGITPDIQAELTLEYMLDPTDEKDVPLQKALEFLCK